MAEGAGGQQASHYRAFEHGENVRKRADEAGPGCAVRHGTFWPQQLEVVLSQLTRTRGVLRFRLYGSA